MTGFEEEHMKINVTNICSKKGMQLQESNKVVENKYTRKKHVLVGSKTMLKHLWMRPSIPDQVAVIKSNTLKSSQMKIKIPVQGYQLPHKNEFSQCLLASRMRTQQNPFHKIKSNAGNHSAARSLCQVTAVICNVCMLPVFSI